MKNVVVDLQNVSKSYIKYSRPLDRLIVHFLEKGFGRRKNTYRKVHKALSGVTLQLEKGECLGVLGMNGAGKSTLLQLIAKTLEPSEGEVITKGRIAALLELGSGFNPEFTGRENVSLNAKILGLTRQQLDERIDAILDFAEIGSFIDQPLKTYSSGMVVRLAFSVLTQIDPAVFIIDEALSVGDAYFSHKSANFIRSFKERGGTLLFCSHNLDAIRTLCDRAILLENGEVKMEGTAEKVVDYYSASISKKWDAFEVSQYKNESGRYVTRSGSGEAKIESFVLENEKGERRESFRRDETCFVRILAKARDAVSELSVGIRIADQIGSTVYGVNTFHLDCPIENCKPGESLEIVFELRLNLGPGEYSLTVAMHSEDDHMKGNFDWIDNIAAFSVLKQEGDPVTNGMCFLEAKATVERK